MFKKIKNFAHNHKDELIIGAKCAAFVVGTVVLYWKSFDYGYNCRVNLRSLREKKSSRQSKTRISLKVKKGTFTRSLSFFFVIF